MCCVKGFIAAGFQPSATNGIYSRCYIVVFANRKKTVLAILGLLSESFPGKTHSPCAPIVTFVLKFLLFLRVKTFFFSLVRRLDRVNTTILES